jgi:hypothetical protein
MITTILIYDLDMQALLATNGVHQVGDVSDAGASGINSDVC